MAPARASVLLLAVAVAAACATAASAQTSRLGKLVVSGVVPCNTGTLIDVATSPAFPDAKVELRCGGSVVAGATTGRDGSFAIEADAVTSTLGALVGACQLVVDTPLAKCNATLPAAGALVSNLQGPLAGMLSGIQREIEEELRVLATGGNIMAPKSLVLAALLVVAAAAGQVPRCAGLGAIANTSVVVSGMVPCAAGNSINMAMVPAFPNAGVQLVCGSNVVDSATTDANGVFVIKLVYVAKNLLTAIMGNQCKVVVVTPLGACDKSLAAATGTLMAPLKLLGINTGTGGSSDLGLGGIIGVVTGIISGIIGGLVNIVTQSFSLV
ncbi:hypothetical protein BAE44_0014831 [Dichanthelium oligosanthes]|uniref:Phylloplanin n=1 Tax=Dichanthelium oligosanthes TaxID=888268 RepID=A0A1E5VG95_9POAL|nr:hypothetical protein BAE44_0014831 [Dichanthelium oligosanthes]